MSLFSKKKASPIVMAAEKVAPKKVVKKVVKKTVAKTVVRKVAPKKVAKIGVKKNVVKKPVQKTVSVSALEIQPEQFFWIYDGIALRDLRDLHEALREMSQEQFDFHTNREGNDFARWIAGVFGEIQLARAIEKARTKEALAKLIANHIK